MSRVASNNCRQSWKNKTRRRLVPRSLGLRRDRGITFFKVNFRRKHSEVTLAGSFGGGSQ